MGVNCCVYDCRSVNNKDKHLKFHKFPKDKTLRKSWLIAIRTIRKIKQYTAICSKHFKVEDYVVTSMGQWKILKKDAVPSLCLPKRKFEKPPPKPRKCRTKPSTKLELETGTGDTNNDGNFETSDGNNLSVGHEVEIPIEVKFEENVGQVMASTHLITRSTQTLLTFGRTRQLISCTLLSEA